MALLKERDMRDVPVFLGGIVPHDDVAAMREAGVTAVFGPGTGMNKIVEAIVDATSDREATARG
jgi:methylmalonyl-CoA mutase C-terminal domain/subunit